MEIIIKLFLLIYVLVIALITILSVIWILTSVFMHERTVKNSLDESGRKCI